MNNNALPDFRSKDFLLGHIASILDFYQPNISDPHWGGHHQNFKDDGSIFNPGLKHLVSTTRLIFNYCKAYQYWKNPQHLQLAEQGLAYLREQHWDNARQGYNWTLQDNQATEQTNHCYGLAFVILAYATCLETGITDTKKDLYAAWDLMEKHLWQPAQGLYADEATADWSEIGRYRGQNANMHTCEALLAAYQATKDEQFLNRAYQLAKTLTVDLAAKANGLVWEHYTSKLEIDWEYNKSDPKNLYRPWGFQPGHQTEWTKLLLVLHRFRPEDWMLERARFLFDKALSICWDDEFGGILYGFAPDGKICDDDKYFWVQAESFAAAALLAKATNDEQYWQRYAQIWQYAWQHMIDHEHGAWYRLLTRDNKKYSDEKSIAGGKCDYHTMGACWEVFYHA